MLPTVAATDQAAPKIGNPPKGTSMRQAVTQAPPISARGLIRVVDSGDRLITPKG